MDSSWISGLSSFQGLQMPSAQVAATPSSEPSVQPVPSSTSGNGQKRTQLEQWATHEGFIVEAPLGDEPDPLPTSSGVAQFASKMVEAGHVAYQGIMQKGQEAGWLPERTQFMAGQASTQAYVQLMATSSLTNSETLQAYALVLNG